MFVLDRPFFATTEANGSFVIDGVPAGSRQLRAWHELRGAPRTEVEVPVGGTVDIVLELPSPC